MTPEELFELIRKTDYKKSGMSVDWKIVVDKTEGVIRLLFQESEDKEDWKVNFNFPAKVYKRQKNFFLVHGGYAKAWKSCNDEIMKSFIDAKLRYPLYKTQIVGWSYGGAMSILAAEDYKFRTSIKVGELITYGSPRPIFGLFSRLHFKKSVQEVKQYTLSYDPVTWLPFFYLRLNTKIVDKKNSWKLWRAIKGEFYHCSYGNKEYYK